MGTETKKPDEVEKEKQELPLEVRAAQIVLNGGRIITSSGRVYDASNVPTSYGEAISSGLNFWVDSGGSG